MLATTEKSDQSSPPVFVQKREEHKVSRKSNFTAVDLRAQLAERFLSVKKSSRFNQDGSGGFQPPISNV